MLNPDRPDSTQSPPISQDPLGSEDVSSQQTLWKTLRSRFVLPWLVAIPVFVILVLGTAAVIGNITGSNQREEERSFGVLLASQEQFDLGVEDLAAGRYEIARQRFEYVISLNPEFPSAVEFLGMALEALDQPTPTAIPVVSPTPTVTPDLGSYESMFQSANAAYARSDWNEALNILIILRGEDPTYRLDEVNQIMSVSLRNRGMDKLFQGRLEEGIYDLNLAERFGPLDSQAISWRRSAEFYMFANSYFGLDWQLAADYFGQICAANIWSACYKYAQSAREYGHLLLEDEDFCQAVINYEQFFAYSGDNAFAPTATDVSNLCLTATAPTPTVTETYTPTLGSPTVTFTSSPTLINSATSTATGAATSTDTLTPTPTETGAVIPTETSTATPEQIPTPTPTSTSTSTPTESP
jgi:tetratricopeptide (TPR) repeat protein